MSCTASLPANECSVNVRPSKGSLMLRRDIATNKIVAVPQHGRARYYHNPTPASIARFERLIGRTRYHAGASFFGVYVRRPSVEESRIFGKLPVQPYRAQATEELLALVEAMD